MTPIQEIHTVLVKKIEGGAFLRAISRQSQQYWWKGLHFQYGRQERKTGLSEFLEESLKEHGNFTGKALKYRVISIRHSPPYLPFALTCGSLPCYADP